MRGRLLFHNSPSLVRDGHHCPARHISLSLLCCHLLPLKDFIPFWKMWSLPSVDSLTGPSLSSILSQSSGFPCHTVVFLLPCVCCDMNAAVAPSSVGSWPLLCCYHSPPPVLNGFLAALWGWPGAGVSPTLLHTGMCPCSSKLHKAKVVSLHLDSQLEGEGQWDWDYGSDDHGVLPILISFTPFAAFQASDSKFGNTGINAKATFLLLCCDHDCAKFTSWPLISYTQNQNCCV